MSKRPSDEPGGWQFHKQAHGLGHLSGRGVAGLDVFGSTAMGQLPACFKGPKDRMNIMRILHSGSKTKGIPEAMVCRILMFICGLLGPYAWLQVDPVKWRSGLNEVWAHLQPVGL